MLVFSCGGSNVIAQQDQNKSYNEHHLSRFNATFVLCHHFELLLGLCNEGNLFLKFQMECFSKYQNADQTKLQNYVKHFFFSFDFYDVGGAYHFGAVMRKKIF